MNASATVSLAERQEVLWLSQIGDLRARDRVEWEEGQAVSWSGAGLGLLLDP